MWFSVVCTVVDNDTRHHSGQNVVDSRGAACTRQTLLSKTFANPLNMQKLFEKIVWEKCNDTCSLWVKVHTKINHISICFLPQYRQRKCFFQNASWKGIAWHTDASSVVWTLIYLGKLANQIARLGAIVVKLCFPQWQRLWGNCLRTFRTACFCCFAKLGFWWQESVFDRVKTLYNTVVSVRWDNIKTNIRNTNNSIEVSQNTIPRRHRGVLSIMPNWLVRDQWEYLRKMERVFPKKLGQPIEMALVILNSSSGSPN